MTDSWSFLEGRQPHIVETFGATLRRVSWLRRLWCRALPWLRGLRRGRLTRVGLIR